MIPPASCSRPSGYSSLAPTAPVPGRCSEQRHHRLHPAVEHLRVVVEEIQIAPLRQRSSLVATMQESDVGFVAYQTNTAHALHRRRVRPALGVVDHDHLDRQRGRMRRDGRQTAQRERQLPVCRDDHRNDRLDPRTEPPGSPDRRSASSGQARPAARRDGAAWRAASSGHGCEAGTWRSTTAATHPGEAASPPRGTGRRVIARTPDRATARYRSRPRNECVKRGETGSLWGLRAGGPVLQPRS